MSNVVYAVIADLPDPTVAAEYVAWLQDGHVDQVVEGGARSAMIVRLEPEGTGPARRVMTHYVFPTREVFEHYVQKHAPVLRADGLKRFPPERGVRFTRLVGDVV